jgi:hypothetical protein
VVVTYSPRALGKANARMSVEICNAQGVMVQEIGLSCRGWCVNCSLNHANCSLNHANCSLNHGLSCRGWCGSWRVITWAGIETRSPGSG